MNTRSHGPFGFLALTLFVVGITASRADATTVTFDDAAGGNNFDIALNYGSNIVGDSTGFVTTDGSGATPNIGLTWLGNVPNEWEYHTGAAWTHESPVHVLQMDQGAGVPPTDNIAEVVFSPLNGRSVQINSFLLSGANDQASTPQVDWEVVGTNLSGSLLVAPGANTGTVDVDFTGTPGEAYTLRFLHIPGSGGSGRGTALDDLSFSEVVLPGVPDLKLTIDRATGGITLTNTGSVAASIKGYAITSEAGSMNQAGWKSIAENYDASGNQAVDTDDNWTELPQTDAYSDLSEFEFSGNGGTIAAAASVVLSQPAGNAWLKSPYEDVKLEIVLTDTVDYSGASPEYSVEYVNGPTSGYIVGDLNFDNVIDAADWPIYNAGRGVDLSQASQAAAYQLGDLDADLDNDIADFVFFKSLFIAAQGAEAWAALGAVPEPTSAGLILMGLASLLGLRRPRLGSARVARQRRQRVTTVVLASLAFVGSDCLTAPATATTVTFATDPLPNNNADLPPDFGSHIAGPGNGFLTEDGTGATPNIGLTWAPTGGTVNNGPDINILEFHSGSAFVNAGFDVPVLQFDVDSSGHSALPADPTIDFNVGGGKSLKLHSFQIGNATDQSEPDYAWTVNLIRLSDMATVASRTTGLLGPGSIELVNFDYIGDPEESYRLLFDDGGANTVRSAIDNLSFSETTETPPQMRIIADTNTGQISLVNDSGTDFTIDSYEITSASGALDPLGWSSLQDKDYEGNGAAGTGNGWEEAGGSSSSALIESFLLGNSTFVTGITPLSLGSAFDFDKPGVEPDLTFRYHIAGTSGFLTTGGVEYTAGTLPADLNSDGFVDGLDLGVLLGNFNQNGIPASGGELNGADPVDGLDLGILLGSWSPPALAGATAIPEPTTTLLLLCGGIALLNCRKRGFQPQGSMPKFPQHRLSRRAPIVLPIVFIGLALTLGGDELARATTQIDRLYQFGDGGASNTLDSQSQGAADRQDLEVPSGAGAPSYVNVSSTGLNRPGAAAGDLGAQFDGANDVLSGIALNRPDETVGPTILGLGPDVFGYPFNYDSITARGLQMWVYPDAASIGNGRQGIVMDTIAAGGVAITADGHWTQSNHGHVTDAAIEATVPVVGDQWHHVMHHIHLSGEPGDPRILPGGQLDRGFTGVVYVNGVAVSANNGQPAPSERNDGGRVGVLAVGAEEFSGNGFEPAFGNYFHGVVDDLEMYVYGDNSSVPTFPAGQDYGTFDLFTDNAWIADQIANIPNGGILRSGDINRDGSVSQADVTALAAGWLNEKKFQGALNEISVGDWETWTWGDLNTDGVVNLEDAILLDSALTSLGLAGVNFDLLLNHVPEPSSLVTASIGLFALVLRRRRGERT